jgi:tetratricopeptide (TPR) repeat protein
MHNPHDYDPQGDASNDREGELGAQHNPFVGNTFVGRERELAELVAACESGADSDTNLLLLYGEPGIGKTRLADELASRVKARGLQVLWGRCWEGDGAPAYWPWMQVIRSFLGAHYPERQTNLAVDSEIPSDVIYALAQIVPELWPAHSILSPSPSDKLEPDEARFRLFDAVTNFLKLGARTCPILVVLDDLHDADEASLALLRFMARELKGAAISIIATYRDLEVRRSPTLSTLIGKIGREARSIPVGGLNEAEVTKFVESRVGRTPNVSLVAKLCAATNGNPLFVDGIVRTLIAERATGSEAIDRPFRVPSGIREAIRGRLDGLSPESNTILVVAAAIGNEFELNLCQSAADVSTAEAQRLLDEASSAGLVTALSLGRYRFAHALIREAVYEELDTNGRVRIHGKIASRLEDIYRGDIDPHLAELAYHFREAGVTEKAIEYLIRAGQAAVRVAANAGAVTHWEAALAIMEAHGMDPGPRALLLEWLGDQAHAIDQRKSVRYRESAINLYESVGNSERSAKVRVRLGRSFATPGQPIANGGLAIAHLRRAESVLEKGPETVELAWLYEAIAAYEQQRLDLPRCAGAAKRAMEISKGLGDRRAWSSAAGFHGLVRALGGQLKEAFEIFDRSFEAADEADLPGSGHAVASMAGWCCIWLGDPRTARGWYERELNRPRNAHHLFTRRGLLAEIAFAYYEEGQMTEVVRRASPEDLSVQFWVRGEWEGFATFVEKAAEAAEPSDDRASHLESSYVLGTSNLLITRDYVRAEAHLKYGLDNGDRGPLIIYEMRVRPFLAQAYVGMNRLDDADEQLARCRQIMAAGEDWRGRVADVACAEAVLAAARGNYDLADHRFASALAIQRQYHLMMAESFVLQNWGRALAAGGDRGRAAEKFDAAIELNRSRGVGPRFLDWQTADKMSALGTSPIRIGIGADLRLNSTKPSLTGAFRRDGKFWTISYSGISFRLKNAKGLHYLAYLLAHPGQRIHVHDLMVATEGSAAKGLTTIHANSENLEIVREIDRPRPTLDPRARSEYRARLRDLHAELDEAERINDLGRCDRIRAEIDAVGQELTGSLGLGGRARNAGGSEERARGLVGKGIRSVVKNIREQHPGLGRHLAAAISTGYFCAYQPEPENTISWQL